ncbi:hypothetical protein LCGC14_1315130, partial [marine sediment metagenome]
IAHRAGGKVTWLKSQWKLSAYPAHFCVEIYNAALQITPSPQFPHSSINRFGRHFANCIRRDRPRPNDKWHMDEVVITIRGKKHWLWRAIDANGDVLDILVQTRRNAKAAKRFLQRLVAQFDEPRVVITDKLRSYIKPIKTLAPDADHRAHKGLNNAIEVSHRPTRKREKMFGRFKSHRQAQRFLSAHDQNNLIFRPRRYQITATSYRHARNDAFSLWADYTAEMAA